MKKRLLTIKKTTTCLMLALLASVSVTGCENMLPGGSDSRNKNFYDSENTLEAWTDDLQIGMTKAETFARLGRVESDFTKLDRNDVVGVLFGSRNGGVPPQLQPDEDIQTFLNEFEGYRLEYRSIKKRHGLTSPIRIQTNSSGFDYTLNLIFKNGVLYEKPRLIGGVVRGINSKTIFDYLNPGTFIDRAMD